MKGYVLFQMWEPARQLLIERHQFYVNQSFLATEAGCPYFNVHIPVLFG
jgi:hypothetical protein